MKDDESGRDGANKREESERPFVRMDRRQMSVLSVVFSFLSSTST